MNFFLARATLLLVVMTLTLSIPTRATTTVYVSPHGTDGPNRGSLTSPLLTLAYASSILPPEGGNIRMFAGVYSGAELSTANVSITPHPNVATTALVFNSTLSVSARGVSLTGFAVNGPVEGPYGWVVVGAKGSVDILSAKFSDTRRSIQVDAGGEVHVEDVEFYLTPVGTAIKVTNPSTDVEPVARVSLVDSTISGPVGSGGSTAVAVSSASSHVSISHVDVANVGTFFSESSGLDGVTTDLSIEYTNVTHVRQGVVISKPYYGIQGSVSLSNTVFANIGTEALTNFERGGLGLFAAGDGLDVSIDRSLFYNISVAGGKGLGGSLSCQEHASLTLTNSVVVSSYAYTDGAAFCDSTCSFTGAGNTGFLNSQSETKGHCNDLR